MKKLLLTVLLSLFACTAQAVDPPSYQATRVDSRFLRIGIIRPSRWDVIAAGNLTAIRQLVDNNFGTILEAARDRGLEVHFYDTAYFESSPAARDLWEDFGSRYAMAIVLPPTASVAGFSRYVCADSTNTNVVVVGDVGGGASWVGDTSTVRGMVDGKGGGYEALSANNQAFCITVKGDTMWFLRMASGRRMTNLASGISRVVRYMNPGTRTGTTWIQDADSVNSNMPGVVSLVPGDTVAAKNDYLGPMWKVVYTNSLADVVAGQSGLDPTARYTNSLPASQCPKEVSFVKFPAGALSARGCPHLLWALIARFTKAMPLRYAFDMDDMADKFADNLGVPERWSNAVAQAEMDSLRFYGAVGVPQLNPDHAAAYMRAGTGLPLVRVLNCTTNGTTSLTTTGDFVAAGLTPGNKIVTDGTLGIPANTTIALINSPTLITMSATSGSGTGAPHFDQGNPRYESPWTGAAHTYLKTLGWWIHHAHDSTSGHPSSNLIGGFGGYSNGNGANYTTPSWTTDILAAAAFDQVRSHRWATWDRGYGAGNGWRDQPGGNYFGPGNTWSIATRLAWSDSVRRVVCPECKVPPYLTFPANTMLPIGFKLRNPPSQFFYKKSIGAAEGNNPGGPICPIDSLLFGVHKGLRPNAPGDSRPIYFGTSLVNLRREYWQMDRDSIAAQQPFLYPNERYSVWNNPDGRYVTAINVGRAIFGGSSWSSYVNSATAAAARTLGLKNTLMKSEQANAVLNEGFNTDMNGVFSLSAGGTLHDHTYAQSPRVFYDHPVNSSPPDYEINVAMRTILATFRAMNDISGREGVKCVRAWEVFD